MTESDLESASALSRALPARLLEIARAIAERGGRALVVGGWVRDRLLGVASSDLDIEVHGLDEESIDAVLGQFGSVHRVGRSFAIRRLSGLDADFSWVAGSHPLTPANLDASYLEAAKRRDLTVNSIGFDPTSETLYDPCGGRADLLAGRLRAVSAERFGEDPIRALRVAQLAARLAMQPDQALLELCTAQNLEGIAGERIFGEFSRLLLRAPQPSRGLEIMDETGQLDFFPALANLRGVPQDPRWHPEGDVWTHTKLVVDCAATLRERHDEPLPLMFGALCHDMGKAIATQQDETRIRSIGHEQKGVAISRDFMRGLEAPKRLTRQVAALVAHHLSPAQFVSQGAGGKAYRKLVRRLDTASVRPLMLADVARADHLGRTTEDARADRFDAGDTFMEKIDSLSLRVGARAPIVQGRHLIDRGYTPGPRVGKLLERCLKMQDESGLTDADAILDRVLGGEKP